MSDSLVAWSDPLVGRELGAFRVTALIGAGGMGRVYAAEHAFLRRRVAIKLLAPQLVFDAEALARFEEEARATNSIRHPNIIDITDFGTLEGRPYFVMEMLDGETLASRIAKWGHLEPLPAVRLCIQVASALTAAHERGVIHRDLKPDNIFICNHPDFPDHVKVLDFGVAKLTQREPGRANTQAGALLGTPLYMSPEQSLGDTVDARSDVYALGCVLYEALVGAPPFLRPTNAQILAAHVHEQPLPPRQLVPTVPEALEAMILRSLAKRPADRFEDMRAMRAALAAFERQPVPVKPAAPPPPAPAAPALESLRPGAKIADTLRSIILNRIETNRLVLPSFPKATSAALKALDREDVDLAKVASLLEQDPLIVPQLLRLGRSVLYGASCAPSSVQQAVMRLGIMQLKTVLFQLSVRRVFSSPRKKLDEAFRGIWRHSVLVGLIARKVCEELGNPVDTDAVQLGGLLHDVGKPLVGVMLLEAEKLIGSNFELDADLWIQSVQQSHREVAVALATKWQLSAELQHVITGCHRYHDGDAAKVTNIVCFANAIAKHAGKTVGPVDSGAVEELISDGADLLGVDWRYVHTLRELLPELEAEASATE